MLQQRAQALLMSNEMNALQQLDAMLTSSQDNLRRAARSLRLDRQCSPASRRLGARGALARRLVLGPGQILGTAALSVDNAPVENRTYTVTSNGALRMGAVDQLYRGDVLPTSHTRDAQRQRQRPAGDADDHDVAAAGETVTYVQFAIRNGQVDADDLVEPRHHTVLSRADRVPMIRKAGCWLRLSSERRRSRRR